MLPVKHLHVTLTSFFCSLHSLHDEGRRKKKLEFQELKSLQIPDNKSQQWNVWLWFIDLFLKDLASLPERLEKGSSGSRVQSNVRFILFGVNFTLYGNRSSFLNKWTKQEVEVLKGQEFEFSSLYHVSGCYCNINKDLRANRFVWLYQSLRFFYSLLESLANWFDVMTLICKNAPTRIKDVLL